MNFLILIHAFAFLSYIFVWASLYSQQHKEPGNRALRLFFLNHALWVFTEGCLFFPASKGLELFFIKAAAVFWIPSAFWFVNFLYRELNRKIDWLYISCALFALAGVVFYFTFPGVLTGYVRFTWGAIDLRGPYHSALSIIPGTHGIVAMWLLISRYRRTHEPRSKQGFLVVLIGAILTLILGLFFGFFLPSLEPFDEWPRYGACASVILVPFILHAMRTYGIMSIQIDQIAEDLFEDVLDGIILLDRDNRVSRMNPAARRMLGISSDKYVSIKASELLPNFDSYGDERNIEVSIKRGNTTVNLSISQSQTTREGISLGKIVLIKDISYEKQAVDILRRSQEELEAEVEHRLQELKRVQRLETIGTIAGGIAHDFNNLLAAIIGFSTAARDDLEEDQLVRKDLDEVLLASRRAREVVNQLLAFSKPQKAQREPVEIGQFLESSLSLVESSLPANIKLKKDLSPEENWVMGDPSQLHQVIMNLFTNAYQAMMEEGGELTISVSMFGLPTQQSAGLRRVVQGDTVQISVSDTGIGIPAITLEHIFEPFYTTRELGEGSGLGLATALRIVKEHAGTITVDSQSGMGSTFSIMLPRIDDIELNQEDPNRAIITGGEHVMWIQNDKLATRIARRLLTSIGYRTTGYTDPHEAIQAFRKTPSTFDVIVSELNMPEMTGVELSREMISERPNIPIILTADSFSQTEENAAKDAGVRALLINPIDKQELGKAIREVLEK